MNPKKRSSHGLLARTVVLNAEDRETFYRLIKDFEAEFHPQTAVQHALIQTMAVARWRQMRIWSMEKAGLDYQMSKQPDTADPATKAALAFRALSDDSRSMELLNRYETRYDRQFTRALTALRASSGTL